MARKDRLSFEEKMYKNAYNPNCGKRLSNMYNYTNNELAKDIYIILDDLEFAWKVSHIEKVKRMWKEGNSFKEICEEFKRDPDEIFLLLFHLARSSIIQKRDGFIWGIKKVPD